MKSSLHFQRRQRGSVLLVCLVTAAILGVTLASYLAMTQAQNSSVVRSQTWNSSLAISEAGVEDALALINKYSGDVVKLPTWTNSSSISGDNWSSLGNNVYYVRRYLDTSSWGTNYYDVYITNLNNAPTIYSVGTSQWNSYASAPQAYFAAAGQANISTTPSTVTRKLKVETKYDPVFTVAMAAVGLIDFNGNNIATDSFDSVDPNYNTGGQYPAGLSSKQKDGGDVVTDAGIVNSVNVGNANIKGKVKTGPGGTIAIGPNGSVGSKAWVEGGNLGIQTGYSANDMNVQFPDVILPSTSWLPAVAGSYNINGKNYKYAILVSGDYTIPGLTGTLYIGTNVNARIQMTGDVNLSGASDEIRIASGAQLSFFMSGASFSVKGNGIANDNGNAANLYYFGLPSNTSISFAGNAAFSGAIYAPQANFTLGGGGSTVQDFIGSSVTKTVTMNGKFNFHYDENLRRVGPARGYIPTFWKEK